MALYNGVDTPPTGSEKVHRDVYNQKTIGKSVNRKKKFYGGDTVVRETTFRSGDAGLCKLE